MWASGDIKIDMITALIRQHQDNYPEIDKKSTLGRQLRNFTITLYKDLTQSAETPKVLMTMSLRDLSRYAYHLSLYRAALGVISEPGSTFTTNYLSYLKENENEKEKNNFYLRGLIEANPFMIKAHVVKLYHEAMSLAAQDKNEETDNRIKTLLAELDKAEAYVAHLDSKHYTDFKYLMDGYIKLILASVMENIEAAPDMRKDETVHALFIASSRAFAAIEGNDHSYGLYANQQILPGLPFENAEEAQKYLETKGVSSRSLTTSL